MQHLNRLMVIVLLVCAALQLTACNTAETLEAAAQKPAVVEPIDGTGLNRVTLSQKASERLDIQTSAVQAEQVDGASRLVVPYGAIIYDLNGETWVYVNPQPLTFVRERVTVDRIEEGRAVLSEGPAVGAAVVTVGAAELYGADTGVGK